jgi:CSLREA domain-containing protein
MSRPVRLTLHPLEDRLAPATFTVTTALDVVDPADGKRSLREAITAANSRPGADLIVVPKGTFAVTIGGTFENADATGDFDITDSVTIRGAGRNLTVLDGRQADRVFHVLGSSPASTPVTLERMTVRNGLANGPGGGSRPSTRTWWSGTRP